MKLNLFNPSRVKPQLMQLQNPVTKEIILDENGKPVIFEVASLTSSVARNFFLEKKKKSELSAEEQALELAVAITLGWSDNVETEELGKLPFSQENARKLFESEDWIANQIIEFGANSENFPLGV